MQNAVIKRCGRMFVDGISEVLVGLLCKWETRLFIHQIDKILEDRKEFFRNALLSVLKATLALANQLLFHEYSSE